MTASWFSVDGDHVLVRVWAVPGASRTEIAGIHNGAVRVRVAAPPEDGKANRAILAFFSKQTGLSCNLVRGSSGRHKIVRFATSDVAELASSLDVPYSG